MPKNLNNVEMIFFGTWIVLGALSSYLFFIRNDYKFKVTYYKYFVILVAFLFIGFVVAVGVSPQAYVILVPGVALVTFLNIKFTQFCKTCGKTIINRGLSFSRIEFCPRCGNKL